MSELQVARWKRYGHDRLYVNLPDGTNVAWWDRKSEQITVLDDGYRDAALDALAPHLPRTTAPAATPAPRAAAPPVLSPADDLARNRPGEALRAKLDELGGNRLRQLLLRLLGRRTETDSWRSGLRGERAVGAALARLAPQGWRALHSVPLPREVDIDHLLIGPGGVFCLNTKHHPGARVWVGDEAVRIGGGSYPYVRKSRAEACRAARALTRACGFAVDVRPVLVFVGTAGLTVVPTLRDVLAIPEHELAALGRASVVLDPDEVAAVFAIARDRRTWAGA